MAPRATWSAAVLASDGDFYLLGVTPGTYDLTVDPAILDALHAAAKPVRVTLTPAPSGMAAAGLEVKLTPKP